jgi:adenylate cyclase
MKRAPAEKDPVEAGAGKSGFRGVSFRTALLSLVLGLILASSLTSTGLGARGLRMAFQSLLEKQIMTTLDAVTSLVEEHFEPAQRLIDSLSRDIRHGRLAIDDPIKLAKSFAGDLEFEEGIAWISFGYPDGRFAGGREEGESAVINVSTPDGGRPGEWKMDEHGAWNPFSHPNMPESYDARERIWYQLATTTRERIWTHPYDFASGERGITVSQAIYGEDDKFLGVLTVDFLLKDIAEYLERLTRDFRGDPLVFSVNGKLLATSKALDNSQVLEKVQSAILQGDTAKESAVSGQIVELEIGGDSYFVGVRTAKIPGGLECVSAILFSRKQVFEGVDQVVFVSLLTVLAALVASLIAGYFLADRMAGPLKVLSNQLARIGNFQLSKLPPPQSRIREINLLSDSVERMRTGLESFSHYVPVDIVRDLIRGGGLAELGGERRDVAVMFCDLAGFSSYSEGIAPETAVQTLTSYFGSFGKAIGKQEGVIDKFLGDGIMALFNAPRRIDEPAVAACRAALEGLANMKNCADLSADFRARVGLHWGEVLVGNVGTADRFTYTAIGDAVNLCSRLEGLNKFYGTEVIASDSLRQLAGDEHFVWRHLDRVSVLGREEPLDVYELLGEKTVLPPSMVASAETYSRGLRLFLGGKAEEALQVLKPLEASDAPSRILISTVEEYLATPPASRSDRIRRFTQK